MLKNLYLLSIILSPLEGRKKRKERDRETEILPLPHYFFKEYQMQEVGTVLLLWSRQWWDFTLSAFESRIKVKRMHTYISHPTSKGGRTLHKFKDLRLRTSGPAFKLSCTILE